MNTKETKPEAKAGHTPGPWKVASSVNHIGVTVWRSDGDGVNYERICRNVSSPANAALIAAAPQLLKALIGLYETCLHDVPGVSEYGEHAEQMREAREAIAKSTEAP